MIECVIRPGRPQDFKLVYDSWLKSFRKSEMTRKMMPRLYNERMESLILDLLKRGASIHVMVDVDDSNYICSWICTSTMGRIPVLHYVWTKTTFRELGLAKKLMQYSGIDSINNFIYTHRAPMARLLEKKSSTFKIGTYDPFTQFQDLT